MPKEEPSMRSFRNLVSIAIPGSWSAGCAYQSLEHLLIYTNCQLLATTAGQ